MKKQIGFTLIEILVVISIIGLLVTLGISAYSEFNRRQTLDQAAKNIVNELRYIQSKASSGDKGPVVSPPTCTESLTGWYFQIINVSPANQYRTYGKCGVTEFSEKFTDLPANLKFVAPAAGTKILFKPLNLGIDQNVDITIQYGLIGTDVTRQKTISVTTGGTIN